MGVIIFYQKNLSRFQILAEKETSFHYIEK